MFIEPRPMNESAPWERHETQAHNPHGLNRRRNVMPPRWGWGFDWDRPAINMPRLRRWADSATRLHFRARRRNGDSCNSSLRKALDFGLAELALPKKPPQPVVEV